MKAKVLIVDDDQDIVTMLQDRLDAGGYKTLTASDGLRGIELIEQESPNLVLLDLYLPRLKGMDVLKRMAQNKQSEDIPVIVMTAAGTIPDAVEAMRHGAYDFLTKPLEKDHLLIVIQKALERDSLKRQVAALQSDVQNRYATIVGDSPKIKTIIESARRAANSDASILLLGESGTGKELFARSIHQWSPRQSMPMVVINCVALTETLLENELFGHERGAFTGAVQARAGWFEQAHGGSIFLDEIGELPLGLQAKLLRTLQEGTLVRLGATREVRIDVRLVAATNRDLAAEADAGRFRQDLFYRLNVVPIRLPSLRERREDIHPLALHFLNRANQIHQRNVHLAPEALTLLEQHPWPGNIRELGNVIERLVLLADHPLVHAPELARYLEGGRASPHSQPLPAPAALAAPAAAPSSFSAPTAAIEAAFGQTNGPLVRDYQPAHSHSSDTLTQALALHQGNQSRAAQSLGLTLRQFAYRLKKAGLR